MNRAAYWFGGLTIGFILVVWPAPFRQSSYEPPTDYASPTEQGLREDPEGEITDEYAAELSGAGTRHVPLTESEIRKQLEDLRVLKSGETLRHTFRDSTAIRRITYYAVDGDLYSPEDGTLRVVFRGGPTAYLYCDVPQETIFGLLDAGSAGHYFAAHVRGRYGAILKDSRWVCPKSDSASINR